MVPCVLFVFLQCTCKHMSQKETSFSNNNLCVNKTNMTKLCTSLSDSPIHTPSDSDTQAQNFGT